MSGVNNNNNNSHSEDNDDPQAEKYRQLFLGDLDHKTTEETLQQYFGKWGEIVTCVVMRRKESKKSRRFGFITYKTAEMLDDAQNNRPHKIDGRKIDTKRATPRDQSRESRISVKKLFVGGLKDDTTEDDIREVFDQFGKIDKLQIIKHKETGKQRGFCFITFEDFDSVDKCVLRQRISVAGKSVDVKKAVPKNLDLFAGRGGRGGFRGGMRGRGGGYNSGHGNQGNYGYPDNMGGPGWYDYGYQGYNGGMGGHYSGRGIDFNYGCNNFYSGYGSGYGGGPSRSPFFPQRGPAPYKNDYGMGGYWL